jgi:polar amino acid transport system substrate-binding protein
MISKIGIGCEDMIDVYLFCKSHSWRAIPTVICILGLSLFFLLNSCGKSSEKKYLIGEDIRWPNLNLLGKERNLTAFNHDLLNKIANLEKFRVNIIPTQTPNLMSDLEQGKIQGILTILEPSYANENLFVFSDPYFLTGPVLIIPSSAPIEGWNEKARKIVGIETNSHALFELEREPSIQIKLYDDIFRALADLSERRIDGVIIPVIPAVTYVTTFYKKDLKIVTPPLTNEGIRLAALKNEEGKWLVERFNAGLSTLKQNGTLAQMLLKWGLIDIELIRGPSSINHLINQNSFNHNGREPHNHSAHGPTILDRGDRAEYSK